MGTKIKINNESQAFKGKVFTIEWYFDDNGDSQALNYFEKMATKDQIKTLELFELIGTVGEIRTKIKFNYEGEKIYAFKPQPHRFLCFFFTGKKIIVTNAFQKKTNKLPKKEKERALKLKDDYEIRVKRGDYYE